jgi:urease accessory protein
MAVHSVAGPDEAALSPAAQYRLMAWLSPAYPVGAFAYSGGIEWAVEAGDVIDADALRHWLAAALSDGAGLSDGVFFSHAYRAAACSDDAALIETAELAAAFVPTRERHLETTTLGRAFIDVTQAAWACRALTRLLEIWRGPVAYPVAVGVACAGHAIPLAPSARAFLMSLTANWISAGVRLIPLGHTDGQRLLRSLEPEVVQAAQRALGSRLDDLGSATFRADLASARHETQYTRLFRS